MDAFATVDAGSDAWRIEKLEQELESVFIVAVDPEQPTRLPWLVFAAFQAADAVIYDDALDLSLVPMLPASCFREPVGGAAVARLRKLAGDGWRIIRLVASTPGQDSAFQEAAKLETMGIRVRILSGPAIAPPVPRLAGFALNGVAG